MILHRHDDALHRQIELARHRLNDADVGLVRHQPVERGTIHVIGFQRLIHCPSERLHRHLEHLTADHRDRGSAIGAETLRHAASAVQKILVSSVRVHMRREDAGLGRRLENDSTRAVGEQHRGRAVLPIGNA